MIVIGYSLIEIATGEEIASTVSLPWRVSLPGIGVVDFDRAGLVLPDAEAPTHMVVERVCEAPPAANAEVASETAVFDGSNVVVTRTYVIPRRLVARSLIVDRLIAMGKLSAARAALDAASLDLREKWNARTVIYADDADALALLDAIGADPEQIMAPE